MTNMTGKREENRKSHAVRIILIVLSIFAVVKMLFFAYGLDEEYQVVMAYRNAMGDSLFLDMWEPHQSSAFLCMLLMKPFLMLTGDTTGLVIYLRVCGTIIHLLISVYFYKVFRKHIDANCAFYLALIYFNTIPKQIMTPEFGMMQVWFFTLMMLFFMEYYSGLPRLLGGEAGMTEGGAREQIVTGVIVAGPVRYVVLAGLMMVLEVLAYPSCLILFPFFLVMIWQMSGRVSSQRKWRDLGIFTGICVASGVLYLLMLLRHNTVEGLLNTISKVVGGDITHSLTVGDKIVSALKCLGLMGAFMVGAFALTYLVYKTTRAMKNARRSEDYAKNQNSTQCNDSIKNLVLITGTIAGACLIEFYYWFILGKGFENMQVHLLTIAVTGIVAGRKLEKDLFGRMLWYGIIGSGLSLVAVLYLTDLTLIDSIPHAMLAAFFGMTFVIRYGQRTEGERRCYDEGRCYGGERCYDEGQRYYEERCYCEGQCYDEEQTSMGVQSADCGKGQFPWISVLLLIWCFTAVIGKGYVLRSGVEYNNVLESGGIMKYGPAKGTISNYMGAYVYNCDYEDWQSYVQDGDKVLIMVDQVMNLGTTQYLFKDVEISHYSIVNPTAYDERLLEYWKQFPEKAPNVIIVDCWYGQLMTDPDNWMMQYIENEFGYTSVVDGRYIRIYRK